MAHLYEMTFTLDGRKGRKCGIVSSTTKSAEEIEAALKVAYSPGDRKVTEFELGDHLEGAGGESMAKALKIKSGFVGKKMCRMIRAELESE